MSIESLRDYLTSLDAFATIKIPTKDIETSLLLQNHSFTHVETTLVFKNQLLKYDDCKMNVRMANSDDKEQVELIARESFQFTRFHMDPLVSSETASEIKVAWATNYFNGKRGDVMLVAEKNNKVAGFILLINKEAKTFIDLIAVHPDAFRNGLGKEMIKFASRLGFEKGLSQVYYVGTQACNTASINLYQRMGFKLFNTENVFHFHA